MSVSVGIPCMKCSLHPSKMVHKHTGKNKTCGLNAAWREMNDERIGRDPSIDKSMTHLNVWMEGSSDMDVIRKVEEEVKRITEERRSFGKRGLRADAVSVIALIEKPNMEYMKDLNYEERVDFLKKSHEVIKGLIHDWNPNWQIISSVQHHDEFGGLSAHNHTLVMVSTKDKDGISNMCAFKEYNLKFFNHINKNYPARMRQIGFDVKDVRTFDQLTEAEKLERKLNPQEYGVDAVLYKQRKQEELKRSIDELEIKKEDLDQELEQTIKEITEAPSLKSYRSLVEENKGLKTEIALKDRIIEKLRSEVESLKIRVQKWRQRFSDVSRQAGKRLMNTFGFDVSEDVREEYPDDHVLAEVNKMQGYVLGQDPSTYRVVPDNSNKGHFNIVSKENGAYKVIESNFADRIQAQNRIKELIKLHKALSLDDKAKLLRKVK